LSYSVFGSAWGDEYVDPDGALGAVMKFVMGVENKGLRGIISQRFVFLHAI
jgi:hypothetical protein